MRNCGGARKCKTFLRLVSEKLFVVLLVRIPLEDKWGQFVLIGITTNYGGTWCGAAWVYSAHKIYEAEGDFL